MNAFTIDLEDWYHGIEIPIESWSGYEPRIHKGLDKILKLLDESDTKATFFILGWIAKNHPEIIKELSGAGHEIASHGYSHTKVYDLNKDDFREEIRSTKGYLEDVSGSEVTAHRSPFFSITAKTLWALDILREEGYTVDCSISPIETWRYGIAACPDEIFYLKDKDIIEFPTSPFQFLSRKWAIGGAYFRILPYFITKNAMQYRADNSKHNMFYIHPWEYDEKHPKLPLEIKARITHYTNLNKTMGNTRKLLNDFQFNTVSSVIEQFQKSQKLPSYGCEIFTSQA
jgi:polysaccharide deacetylase family protein (PEP-CTERM system associated)